VNFKALRNTLGNKIHTLPIVILYVTEGCNLKCAMCSYRSRLPDELTYDEIEKLALELAEFGLKRIVYSGGEPLLRPDLEQMCEIFAKYSVKQTLLTNGVLVKKKIDKLAQYLDELIISIDGAKPETHDAIRGVNSLNLIIDGIRHTKENFPNLNISFRTVIQKNNFREIKDIVLLGLDLNINRVSFLPVDVYSEAFGRENNNIKVNDSSLLLSIDEISELRKIIDDIDKKHFESHFVSEPYTKLMGYADYFSSAIDGDKFPPVICNAPMMSTVITATGDVLPCFFLPKLGNIREKSIMEILDGDEAINTRKRVRAFEPERCKTCVCSLNVTKLAALKGNF
jgi:MoaA/NifB/PqqE/SkfB family radical SAM enzyme